MAKETKRQHFVPRTYLKHFAETNKQGTSQICVQHSKEERPSYKTNIENVCHQNSLYTIDFPNATQEQRHSLDIFYERTFESDYDSILELLLDDEITQISQNQKELIIGTIISMHLRVAKWLNTSKENQKLSLEQLLQISKDLDYYDVDLGNGTIWDISDKTVDDLMKELEAKRKLGFYYFQIRYFNKLIQARRFNAINVYKNSDVDEYITSDVPIVLNNGQQELTTDIDKNCHLSLHLTPEYCITIMPIEERKPVIARFNMEPASSKLYTAINNDHQFRNSERYILGAESGIQNYNANKEKYNDEKYVKQMIKDAKADLEKEKRKAMELEMKNMMKMYKKL